MSGMAVAAKRYAKALFEAANEKGEVEQAQQQLSAIAQAVKADAQLRLFFEHPNIGSDEKIRVIKSAVEGKVSSYVLNAVQLLIERGRSSALPAVAEAFSSIADEALGRASAQVVSAFELSEEQKNEIAQKFSALSGKKVSVESVVDASLLGGIRVRIGDMLYDGSLSTRLSELERSFNQAR
jgi:F-type H+-transporting ATPase subunit delta